LLLVLPNPSLPVLLSPLPLLLPNPSLTRLLKASLELPNPSLLVPNPSLFLIVLAPSLLVAEAGVGFGTGGSGRDGRGGWGGGPSPRVGRGGATLDHFGVDSTGGANASACDAGGDAIVACGGACEGDIEGGCEDGCGFEAI